MIKSLLILLLELIMLMFLLMLLTYMERTSASHVLLTLLIAIFRDEITISDDIVIHSDISHVYDGCLVQVGDSTVLSGVG